MPTLTIFAGVNGAGKTTLYRQKKNALIDLGTRINVDEILIENGGNDKSFKDFIKAVEIFKQRQNYCIENAKSFNFETILISNQTIKFILLAKQNGFKINVNFVYAQSIEQCKQRVKYRVKNGGHYVPERLIENRFNCQLNMFSKCLKHIDECVFYENKNEFKVVGMFKNNCLVYQDSDCEWFNNFVSTLTEMENNNFENVL